MNRHFPTSYQIIQGVGEVTPLKSNGKPWYGIILHEDTVIETITVGGVDLDAAAALLLIKNIAVGTAFLMEIAKIKLSAGACKMINFN